MGNITKDLAWKEEIPQTATVEQIEAIKARLNTETVNVSILNEVYDEDGDEIVVGEVRKTIDGVKKKKPLYKKVVDCSSSTTDGHRNIIAHNISDVDQISLNSGRFISTSGIVIPCPQNYVSSDESDNNANICIRVSTGKVVITITTSMTISKCYATVQYTKTTDQWTPV